MTGRSRQSIQKTLNTGKPTQKRKGSGSSTGGRMKASAPTEYDREQFPGDPEDEDDDEDAEPHPNRP